MSASRTLSGWGRYPVRDTRHLRPRPGDDLAAILRMANGGVIARGNGRAYGDSAIGAGVTLDMRHFNRMLSFDATAGVLVAEAGVILGDVIAAFLPRGWFPFVTPGTKFVTLGGAIAADVHGKNHHKEGSFGAFVDWVEILRPDGQIEKADQGSELFAQTLGGMGLTGVILRAAIRLRPVDSAWIRQTTRPSPDLFTTMALFEATKEATYSVAWIDGLARGRALGRSILMLGEHAARADLKSAQARAPFKTPDRGKKTVPLDFPGWAMGGLAVRSFNALYYAAGCRRPTETLIDWDSYFYPLDAILGWNRIYGRRGFAQFQCVLPVAAAGDGLTALLTATSRAGQGSFLAVLKRLGAQESPVSFPMEGYTLAMDFPMNRDCLRLMEKLDRITLDHGGRFYLAKDSRMSRDTLHKSDPRLAAFAQMRRDTGLSATLASCQSERLAL